MQAIVLNHIIQTNYTFLVAIVMNSYEWSITFDNERHLVGAGSCARPFSMPRMRAATGSRATTGSRPYANNDNTMQMRNVESAVGG